MITINNYLSVIDNKTLTLFTADLKEVHETIIPLIEMVLSEPILYNDPKIKQSIGDHLIMVNNLLYNRNPATVNITIKNLPEFKQPEATKTIPIKDVLTDNLKVNNIDQPKKFNVEIIDLNEAKETEQKENQLNTLNEIGTPQSKSNTYKEPIKPNEPIKSIIEVIGSNTLTSIKEMLSPKRDNNLIDTIKDYSYLFKNTQLKDEIIQQRINSSGLSNSRIMHKCGVSYATFYKYRIALEGCGLIPSDWATKNKAGRPKIY